MMVEKVDKFRFEDVTGYIIYGNYEDGDRAILCVFDKSRELIRYWNGWNIEMVSEKDSAAAYYKANIDKFPGMVRAWYLTELEAKEFDKYLVKKGLEGYL